MGYCFPIRQLFPFLLFFFLFFLSSPCCFCLTFDCYGVSWHVSSHCRSNLVTHLIQMSCQGCNLDQTYTPHTSYVLSFFCRPRNKTIEFSYFRNQYSGICDECNMYQSWHQAVTCFEQPLPSIFDTIILVHQFLFGSLQIWLWWFYIITSLCSILFLHDWAILVILDMKIWSILLERHLRHKRGHNLIIQMNTC